MTMLRAIFFDLDGTLIDRASAHQRYCLDLMERHPEVFPKNRRAADLQTLTEGCDDPGWDRRFFSRRAVSAFPALGLTSGQLARDHALRLPEFISADPDVIQLLAGLGDRYRLAIVSNGSGQVQRAKLARLGLGDATPRAFLSGEVGVAKPAPALFQMALDWADCRPEEVLFVGDDPQRDIVGAAGAGMTTCWVSGGRPYPAGLPSPDRTVGQVTALEEILG